MNPKVKEKIDSPLGTFKSFDNGCVSLDLREDWRNVIHKAFLGEVFEKDGLKGGMIVYGVLYFQFQLLGFIFEVIAEWLFGGS